mmetsp:Transcript_5747/g.14717  ORF Transcript_5747/g.14717 Transcript_5747/m.14717 type:complete len:255 (-) Transcript_5747:184-948(-)
MLPRQAEHSVCVAPEGPTCHDVYDSGKSDGRFDAEARQVPRRLAALVVFVLLPMWAHPRLCEGIIALALACAAAEWAVALARSPLVRQARSLSRPRQGDYAKVVLCAVGLLAWAIPTSLAVHRRINGKCPGFQRTVEAVPMLLVVSDISKTKINERFGNTQFAPRISPKFKVEGYVGAGLLAVCFVHFVHDWPLIIGSIVYAAGCIGELYFCAFQRIMGVKDFRGQLGPNASVADRIPSFVFGWAALSVFCDVL